MSRCTFRIAVCALAGAATATVAAESLPVDDEIVVTASRVPLALKSVGSAMDILTAADIAARPRLVVSDLLRELSGMAVNRGGGLGALTQVRMRGAEADHTVVLIDGVQAGDPFNNGSFDFGNLLTAGIDRIEVLRGPQSALYGAQAIGGVVNIVTTRGSGPPQVSTEAQGGSFGTYGVGGTVKDGGSGYGYGATAAYLSTRGVSQSRIQPEPDGHHDLTLNASGRADVTDTLSLDGAVRFVDAFARLDSQDFRPGSPTAGLVIDSNAEQRTRTFSGQGTARLGTLDGAWDHQLRGALTSTRNRTTANGALSFGSNGRKLDLAYQTDARLAEGHAVTGAVEYRDEHYDALSGFPGPQNQSRATHFWGLVGEYRATVATGVHLSAAVRHDINQLFADDTTWRVTSAWEIPATPVKLRASYGTGVAKPGFYEMFGFDPTSFRGNPALKPERSRGWDVGADVALGKRGRFALSYFDANLRDEIVTDFTVFPFTTRNLAGASSRRGVEASLRYAPVPALALAASYGFTDSKDDKGVQEVRRPRNVASVSATGTLLGDRLHVGVSVDYNGAMVDLSFVPASPGRVVLKAYALTTATAAYRLTDHVELFGRIENLFDADYQEVFSYNHLGRGAYGGVKVRFGG